MKVLSTTAAPTPTHHLQSITLGPILPDRVCDRVAVLQDLAKGESITHINAYGCGGNSSDALIIKDCSAPPLTKWKVGIQVKGHCNLLPHYIPVAVWDRYTFTNAGVLASCNNDYIKVISQSCGSVVSLHDLPTPLINDVYTVTW